MVDNPSVLLNTREAAIFWLLPANSLRAVLLSPLLSCHILFLSMAPLSLSCFPSLAVFLFELLALNCVHNFLISYSLPLLTSSSLSTLLSPCFYLLINYILSFKTITMMKDPRCEGIGFLSICPFPPLLPPQAYLILPGLLQSSRDPAWLGSICVVPADEKVTTGVRKGQFPWLSSFGKL